MFGIIKTIFIGLLTSIVNASNNPNCMSLSNQNCITQPTFINLHPNEYSQDFTTTHQRLNQVDVFGSCNTLNDLPKKVCVPIKTKDSNIYVFKMITGKNESKMLAKDISSECKCRFDEMK